MVSSATPGDQRPTPEPLSPEREQEIRELTEAATPGPWLTLDDQPSLTRLVRSDDYTLVISLGYVGNRTQNDAEFIAAAREDVPALLAEVDRLRAELAGYESMTPQSCPKRLHPDWLVDSEDTHQCPWCQLAEARATALNDAVKAAWGKHLTFSTGKPVEDAYDQGVADAISEIGNLPGFVRAKPRQKCFACDHVHGVGKRCDYIVVVGGPLLAESCGCFEGRA